jgi:hypothetical protein
MAMRCIGVNQLPPNDANARPIDPNPPRRLPDEAEDDEDDEDGALPEPDDPRLEKKLERPPELPWLPDERHAPVEVACGADGCAGCCPLLATAFGWDCRQSPLNA